MNKFARSLLFSSLLLALTACQSHTKRDFEKLKIGMYKEDVLDVMGSPHRRQRWQGMDRWTYIYMEEHDKIEKEVRFSEGRAQYLGSPYVPAVSADDQDRIYEAQNAEIEKELAARREENRQAFPRYEDNVRGTNEIRYVPRFVPLQ